MKDTSKERIASLLLKATLPDELKQRVANGDKLTLEEARQVVDAGIANEQLDSIYKKITGKGREVAYSRRVGKGSKRQLHTGFTPHKKKRK